ncbi:hypothetical protein M409DRAFT_50646 [Zasmidium cellare ATCC 36951]|uniref:Uncharacterized protein n=1 Tax=Zasmidium cellare ATCC 36951 TaxID=1080233 RepID=A0A6A6CYB4_ZASCE|nr:uncharacterized protein M409DRAFT_50646 [Zasmidium cellare ATCC 36951]KAF2171168.1 hypothetical protein M409DRAFT_50646 [Zasmidium cellare ATCC 36951]
MSSPTKQSEEVIDRSGPELDEEEIGKSCSIPPHFTTNRRADGYIISTPVKSTNKAKLPTTRKPKKSTKTVNEACLLTPSSLASPAKTKHDGMETPKKQVGVFGHDARQWTIQGDHTPPRASWRSQKE